MRVTRSLFVVGSAAVVVGALTVAGGAVVTSAAGPSRAIHPAAHPSAQFLAEAHRALVGYLRHDHPQADFVHPGEVQTGITSTTKTTEAFNWSGYADVSSTKHRFTAVSGHWAVPAVTCTPEDEISSDWVGLDGFNTDTVEQDGTISWCFEGKPVYFTWYEMFPAATVEVGTTLKPGDLITASVTRSGKHYTLSVTDSTNTANSFSVTKTCKLTTCLDESAEWISERPAFSIGIAPLADYGTWTLSGAAETAKGKSGDISSYSRNYDITMLDATGSYDLSTTSGLTSGDSFTTTWLNSY
jgi:Peptidase A4 family